jgi:methylated-DNA-protein-cysteine methyltransferase-like protein
MRIRYGSSFFQRVYQLVAQIPAGKVATYGQVAALLGSPGAARTVGWAMQAAPRELDLACHRVVNAAGTLSPPETFGGEGVQSALLEAEGIHFRPDRRIDLASCLWEGPEAPSNQGS